jgi:predicted negative regulator of RcsB-dependent stress response
MWFHRSDALIGAVILAGVVWFVWSRWQHRIQGNTAAESRPSVAEP